MSKQIISYKKTNAAWMPEIPVHWNFLRLGSVFEERSETVSENDFEALSVTMKGIVPQLDNAAKTVHVDNRKKVCVGDFAINSRSDRRGAGGVSMLEGSVSIINIVLKSSKYFVPDYTHFLLTSKQFQDEFFAKGKGIVSDMWSTKFSEMKTINLPIPPINEQESIVEHIKIQSQKINHFIQKKHRFIELLKEQRQSIVDRAVSKGINSKVQTKNSNIDWLDNIPEHWQLRRLKYCVLLNTNEYNVDDLPLDVFKIALENIDNWTGKYIETGNYQFEGKGNRFNAGDVLFNKLRPYLAKAFIAKDAGFSVGELLVLTPVKELITSEFLFQRLMTKQFIDIVNSSTYGAKMPRANWDFIGNLKIPIPPIEEQQQIVAHIKTETQNIDAAIAKAQKEIDLIKEYKEAMISEAVMGKIKM